MGKGETGKPTSMSPENLGPQVMVPLGLLRRYLTAHGWRLAEGSGPTPPILSIAASGSIPDIDFFKTRAVGKRNVEVYVLSEPGFDDIELVVPKDSKGADFEQRMQGAIVTLSQLEDKEPDQIVTSVRSIGFDVVRSRIPDELVIEDTIHLESAQNYITGMRDLLAATATTELRPQPFFGRASKEGTEYSDKCRFGHTYRGSFGFTIESPVSSDGEEVLFVGDPVPPFERRVMQRLATGIQHVCEAVDIGDVTPLVDGFRNGFGANGCDRFATLIHRTAYSGMSFGFAFSPQWPVPRNLTGNVEFFVGPRHVEMARVAADKLRGESVPFPVELFGRVVGLQNEADPSDLTAIMGEAEISVLYSHDLFGEIHVRITLPPADYLKAVEAHRLGRAVRISGTLIRRGRFWYLNEPSELTMHYQGELEL
jgi:hypothetical protein